MQCKRCYHALASNNKITDLKKIIVFQIFPKGFRVGNLMEERIVGNVPMDILENIPTAHKVQSFVGGYNN